jgi:hypothetical protein
VLHPVLHYEPSMVALLGTGLLLLVTDMTPGEALADVEWPTLVFFAGLFVMVGGLVATGVIGDLSQRRRMRRRAGSGWRRCGGRPVGNADGVSGTPVGSWPTSLQAVTPEFDGALLLSMRSVSSLGRVCQIAGSWGALTQTSPVRGSDQPVCCASGSIAVGFSASQNGRCVAASSTLV